MRPSNLVRIQIRRLKAPIKKPGSDLLPGFLHLFQAEGCICMKNKQSLQGQAGCGINAGRQLLIEHIEALFLAAEQFHLLD